MFFFRALEAQSILRALPDGLPLAAAPHLSSAHLMGGSLFGFTEHIRNKECEADKRRKTTGLSSLFGSQSLL